MIPWILAALVGCRGGGGGDAVPEEGASTPPPENLVEIAPDAPTQVTGRLLEVGAAGAAPRHVLVQLSHAVFDSDTLGTSPEGLQVSVTPELPGAWIARERDVLEFTPDAPMKPGEVYAFSVDGLPTIEAFEPSGLPWSRRVSVPAFEVRQASLWSHNRLEGVIALGFTNGVDAAEVRRRVKITQQGKDRAVQLAEQIDANTVHVRFEMGQGPLVVELARGVPWASDRSVVAPALSKTLDPMAGPSVTIEHVARMEGRNGHFLEVICDDDGAKGEHRYYRDRSSWDSWYVSSRCLLDEDWVASHVQTDPAVPGLSVGPGVAGFRLFGDFPRGEIKVTIMPGATTVDGGVIKQPYEGTFTVPARTAQVGFAQKGRYLPRDAWDNLGIRHLNLTGVGLEVRHVPPENLVFWMTGDEPTTQRTSNRILKTSVAVPNTPDEEATSWLAVGDLVPGVGKGVYELNLSGEGVSDSARLMLTDMHLVAKAAAPEPGDRFSTSIQAWALDVHTGEALHGATVRLVRASGKRLGQCVTRGDSGCVLKIDDDDVDPAPPVALIAVRDDDMTYLELDDLRLDLPEATGGLPYRSKQPYTSPMYTDRGVYRPGESARLTGIVRDPAFQAPEAGLPVIVRLYDPQDREVRMRTVASNDAGLWTVDLPFGDYAPTGRYRAVAEIGDRSAGQLTFQVEEFVPERMSVTAEIAAAGVGADQQTEVDVGARWLFGGSTVGSSAELTCRFVPGAWAPAGGDGFSWGPAWRDGVPEPISLATLTGTLDEAGATTLSCPSAESGGATGPGHLVAQAAVFEGESGRTTVASARAPVHPEPWVVGLSAGRDRVRAGETVKIQGRVTDWAGKASTVVDKLSVEVFRMEEEYTWYWDEYEYESLQQRSLRPVRQERTEVAVSGGGFSLDVVPSADAAGFLVRATAGRHVSEVWIDGHGRYGWQGQSVVDSTPRPLRPANLPIEVSGPVQVGERVDVKVRTPFPGRVLMTVETDALLQARWLDAEAGEVSWSFSLSEFHPNVYVSAFLVKDPHLESQRAFLPDRAFGVRSVEVVPAAQTQALALSVPGEVRPYSRLSVTVDLKGAPEGPTYVTVAAVDEGILQLTRFESPDPLSDLMRQRALGVDTYETVGWTRSAGAQGPSSSTGGDGGDDWEGASSTRVQMVKPVALWSGLVRVASNGKATVNFQVPGYRGKLRVMAVSASAGRIGHAEAQVTVRDPLVLLTTLPRFLLGGDEAQIPVFVSNTTAKPQTVQVSLTATELATGARPDATDGSEPIPILTFLGAPKGTLRLDPGESKTAVFSVRTREQPGAAHFEVIAEAGPLRSREELDLPILPAASETREVNRVPLIGGQVDLAAAIGDQWLQGSDTSTVWVTPNPYAQAMGHLRYLVRYPYG